MKLQDKRKVVTLIAGLLISSTSFAAGGRPNLGNRGRTSKPSGSVKLPPRTSGIVQPKVIKPVGRRKRPVAPRSFGPKTQLTIGLYNEEGNVVGSKVTTGGVFHKGLEAYTKSNIRSYARTKPINGKKLSVIKRTVFDRRLKQNLEVVMIPQGYNDAKSLDLQSKLFKPAASSGGVMAPPGSSGPKYGHLTAIWNKEFGKKSKFAAYIRTKVLAYGSKLQRKTEVDFKAGGYVFNKNVKMIEFSSKINRGQLNSYSHFTVMGTKKWQSTANQPKANEQFTRSKSKRMRIWVGPLPISVGGSIGGTVKIKVDISSPSTMRISGNVTPSIDAHASVDAAIDIWAARAGVEGRLVILQDKLPSALNLQYNSSTNKVTVNLNVRNELQALKGKIDIYAKVRKFWGGWKKWTKTLFSWNGIKNNWQLINKNITVEI